MAESLTRRSALSFTNRCVQEVGLPASGRTSLHETGRGQAHVVCAVVARSASMIRHRIRPLDIERGRARLKAGVGRGDRRVDVGVLRGRGRRERRRVRGGQGSDGGGRSRRSHACDKERSSDGEWKSKVHRRWTLAAGSHPPGWRAEGRRGRDGLNLLQVSRCRK